MSDIQSETPPKILWHYTTVDTLTEILKSRSLLASDFRDTNDRAELKHGMKLLRDLFGTQNRFSEIGNDPLPEHIRSLEESILMDVETRSMAGQMICFSTTRDSLSMWRGYGQVTTRGGNGAVAIGFHTTDLQSLCNADATPTKNTAPNILSNVLAGFRKIQPVRYDFSQLPQLSSALVQSEDTSKVHMEWAEKLAQFIKHRKDPAFAEEQEWRLWGDGLFNSRDTEGYHYSVINNRFRRRFHLTCEPNDLGRGLKYPLAIREIIAGPTTDVERLKRFCETWFHINGAHIEPKICPSSVPFQ